MKKLIIALTMILFVVVGCKNETKKDTKSNEATREVSFNISGMTCEVGCAKTIESKLSKKDGVLEAKVVFADSIATVKFDTSKTNKKELMAFVNDIADGETYKTFERKSCSTKNKKSCSTDKKDTKKSCSTDKKEAKSCKPDCEKPCCTNKKDAKACKTEAKKSCSTDKKEAKSCKPDCEKSCCKKA